MSMAKLYLNLLYKILWNIGELQNCGKRLPFEPRLENLLLRWPRRIHSFIGNPFKSTTLIFKGSIPIPQCLSLFQLVCKLHMKRTLVHVSLWAGRKNDKQGRWWLCRSAFRHNARDVEVWPCCAVLIKLSIGVFFFKINFFSFEFDF